MTVSSFHPPQRILMGPGPSDVHPRVLQAMGRPIIATAHGGALETVEDGKSGWLYPVGDAEALAKAADAALSMDNSAREHMGLAGRARVVSRFSLSVMGRDTLEIYRRVAKR